MTPKRERRGKKRWVLGEGYTLTDMNEKNISLWNEWGSFGPKEILKLKIPSDWVLGTKIRLIAEEV